MSSLELPRTLPIADGRLLYSPRGPRALEVASDEDWAECLVRARLALSNGSKRVGPGQTWEEALAAVASWYLSLGTSAESAMGRTADAAAWREQERRWIERVWAEADKGSAAQEQGYRRAGEDEFLTRAEAEASVGPLEPVWRAEKEGTVLGPRGRTPWTSLPRSDRAVRLSVRGTKKAAGPT
jgi:hypothetical protein